MMNSNEVDSQKIKQSLKARKTQIKIQAKKIEQALQKKPAKETKKVNKSYWTVLASHFCEFAAQNISQKHATRPATELNVSY
jgi:hypothetical protein